MITFVIVEPIILLFLSMQEQVQFTQPWVGLLRFKRNDIGTGIAISHQLVLTAAYNVFSQHNSQRHQGPIQFILGNGQSQLQIFQVTDFRILNQYKTLTKKDRVRVCYALLKLDRCVKSIPFPTLQVGYQYENKDQISLFGYPVPQNQNVSSINNSFTINQKQYVIESIANHDQKMIRYKAQTYSGQGGGPIVVNKNGRYSIVAIHVVREVKSNQKLGVKITEEVENNLIRWAKEMNSHCHLKFYKQEEKKLTDNKHQELKNEGIQMLKQYNQSDLKLRQQNEFLKKYQQKYQSLSAIMDELQDLKHLPLQRLMQKIDTINSKISKHKLQELSISAVKQKQEEYSKFLKQEFFNQGSKEQS